jgi:hypothetical protein
MSRISALACAFVVSLVAAPSHAETTPFTLVIPKAKAGGVFDAVPHDLTLHSFRRFCLTLAPTGANGPDAPKPVTTMAAIFALDRAKADGVADMKGFGGGLVITLFRRP